MTGHTQLFEASATYQLLALVAAIDSGRFGPADRRILLTSANTRVPETARRIEHDPAVEGLLSRFDQVVSYNDLIAPLHPSDFRPRVPEQVVFRRLLRQQLDIPDDHTTEVVVESVHVPPGRTLINVFGSSSVTVYAEGLMSYGPTRDPMTTPMAARIERVLYLDLIPGLRPMLLSEHAVPTTPIDDGAFRAAVRELRRGPHAANPTEPYALVLGQYLSELRLIPARREAELYADLVDAAAREGLRTVVFKPHPSAPAHHLDVLAKRAAAAGVTLLVNREAVPVEAIYEAAPPALVLGCFSTGLVTATRYWSIPTRTLGIDEVLASLTTFENSNRIPLMLVDRTVPRAAADRDPAPAEHGRSAELQQVLDAVGYCMQWQAHDRMRLNVVATLRRSPGAVERYVSRGRLRQLALPGGWPVTLSEGAFRRAANAYLRARDLQLAATTLGRRISTRLFGARLQAEPDFT